MSIDATSFVWKLTKDEVTSTEKYILLSLADRANEDHECWPSKKRLAQDTLLDRKTIFSAISSLVKKGILIETGEKKGQLKKISVYKINNVLGREDNASANRPKNGTIKNESNSNRPKNGTFNRPKNGTFNRTENGIQNLSVEPNIEPINKKHASGEAQNLSYTQSDGWEDKKQKSDYPDNHGQPRKDDNQVIDSEIKTAKSDYFENNTLKQQLTNSSKNFSIKDILQDNIFQIPEQIIHDWIANRKKKRAALTLTAWKNLNKELANCKKIGLDPIDTIAKVVAKGWTAFEAEWFLTKDELTKYEAAKKRSIELEQEAERRKKKEIEETKRASRVTKASDLERERVRKLVGARAPGSLLALPGA